MTLSLQCHFYPNVTTLRSLSQKIRLSSVVCQSSVCLSVACNVRAPYSRGWNFRRCFFSILYLWPPCKILRRLSQGNPSVWGVKRKRRSKIERCHVRVSHLLMSFLTSHRIFCNVDKVFSPRSCGKFAGVIFLSRNRRTKWWVSNLRRGAVSGGCCWNSWSSVRYAIYTASIERRRSISRQPTVFGPSGSLPLTPSAFPPGSPFLIDLPVIDFRSRWREARSNEPKVDVARSLGDVSATDASSRCDAETRRQRETDRDIRRPTEKGTSSASSATPKRIAWHVPTAFDGCVVKLCLPASDTAVHKQVRGCQQRAEIARRIKMTDSVTAQRQNERRLTWTLDPQTKVEGTSPFPPSSPPLGSRPLTSSSRSGERCKLPKRVRAEPGCQSIFSLFWAENASGETKFKGTFTKNICL